MIISFVVDHVMTHFVVIFLFSISKFHYEIKLKRYLHEMTDVVIAGTKVDGAGEERSPQQQKIAVVRQGTKHSVDV